MPEVESYTYKQAEIEIVYDSSPSNPRDDCNLGAILIPGSRNLPDINETDLPQFIEVWDRNYGRYYDQRLLASQHAEADVTREEFENYLIRNGYIFLRVYAYIHSGIALSTSGFACPWDSRQVGYIMVKKSAIRKEYGWKNLTAKRLAQIEGYLKGEIDTLGQYWNGEVYGYVVKVTDDSGAEHEESCWGYYGTDYCKESAQDMADYLINKQHLTPTLPGLELVGAGA